MAENHHNQNDPLDITFDPQLALLAGASVVPIEAIAAIAHGGLVGGALGLAASAGIYCALDEYKKHHPSKKQEGEGSNHQLPSQQVRSKMGDVWYRLNNGRDARGEVPKDGRDEPQTDKLSDDVNVLFPQYPEDETLRLGRVVETGQRFDPHFDNFFESGCFISAVQGSGKSILVGRVIEQFGKCGGPSVVFDHKGEYWPITELPFINGLRAGSSSLVAKIGGDTFELTPQTVDAFVQKVQVERKQAIIHLPSYGDNWIDRARVVSSVGLALMKYSRNEREQGRIPLPCMVVMDEAQLYIPQDQGLLPSEAQKKENSEILDTLNNSYYAMVSNGRSNGYCVVFATQSPTYVKKWAIKSCQFRVYMRATEFNDLNALEKIISPTIAKREDIEVFGKGKGVAFGLTARPVVVQFDMKESRDLSNTPKRSQLREVVRSPYYEQTTQYSPVSFSSGRQEQPNFYAQNEKLQTRENENERLVKEPVEPDENDESFNERNETFMASREDETAILMAVIDLQMANTKVTREAIKSKLKWNNAKHPALKSVCDKHGIAVR